MKKMEGRAIRANNEERKDKSGGELEGRGTWGSGEGLGVGGAGKTYDGEKIYLRQPGFSYGASMMNGRLCGQIGFSERLSEAPRKRSKRKRKADGRKKEEEKGERVKGDE